MTIIILSIKKNFDFQSKKVIALFAIYYNNRNMFIK